MKDSFNPAAEDHGNNNKLKKKTQIEEVGMLNTKCNNVHTSICTYIKICFFACVFVYAENMTCFSLTHEAKTKTLSGRQNVARWLNKEPSKERVALSLHERNR